jgi:transcriptional regulator with XRE-family HTH domain
MSADPGRRPPARAYGAGGQLSKRLREARTTHALSLRQLAARVGVSASLISQIETGKVQPSVNTLYALAIELGLSIDDLLDASTGTHEDGQRRDGPAFVQRAEDRKVIELGRGVRWERLTGSAEPGIDFLYVVYQPGSESAPSSEPHRHSGREWGHVLRGTLVLEVGDETYTVRRGESVMFDSTVPHRLHNPGDEEMHGIWFVLGRHRDARLLDT